MPFIKLKETTLYYELQGQGDPVLFIQGCGVAGSGWDPQVQELAGSFRCLTFDNRGMGRSAGATDKLSVKQMAADALALLDAMGWDSAHVVGHSLGGVIAQQLALDTPKRIKSLSLLCTFSKGAEGGRITPSTAWMGLRTRLGTRAMRRRAFLRMLRLVAPFILGFFLGGIFLSIALAKERHRLESRRVYVSHSAGNRSGRRSGSFGGNSSLQDRRIVSARRREHFTGIDWVRIVSSS